MSEARHPRPGLGRDVYGSPYEDKEVGHPAQATLFLVTNEQGACLMYGDAMEDWLHDQYEHIMEGTLLNPGEVMISQDHEQGRFGDDRIMVLLPGAKDWRKVAIEVNYHKVEGSTSKISQAAIRVKTSMFGEVVKHYPGGPEVRVDYTGFWVDRLNELSQEEGQ